MILAIVLWSQLSQYRRGNYALVADRALSVSDFAAFYCGALAARTGQDPYKTVSLESCQETRVYRPGGMTLAKTGVDPAPLPGYDFAIFVPLTLLPYRTAALLWIAHVVATPPPAWTIAIYDLACVAAATALARARIIIAIGVLAGATALCLWPPRAIVHDLVVTAIDVGQADALLVQTPSGHSYLVDAGGRLERGGGRAGITGAAEDVGERIVAPFLRGRADFRGNVN